MRAAKCLAVLAVLSTVGQAHGNSFASGFHMFHLPCIAGVCLEHSTWHTYASCEPTVVSAESFIMRATMEMNATKDSYSRHYDYTTGSTATTDVKTKFEGSSTENWIAGKTRVNVTLIDMNGAAADAALGSVEAEVFTTQCAAEASTSTPLAVAGGQRTFKIDLKKQEDGGDLAGTTTEEQFVDYDQAASVKVYLPGGQPPVCCDLVPDKPILPGEFTATIEANFKKSKVADSFTIHRREYYSSMLNAERIDEHSNLRSTVEIRNYNQNTRFVLYHNTSYPNGYCEEFHMDEFELGFEGVGGHLQSTAGHLAFGHPSARSVKMGLNNEDHKEVYHGADHEVRGIKCEKWSYDMSMPDFHNPGNGVNNYTVSHFFPDSDWQVRSEMYHRLPKRILLEGTRANGEAVLHYYDYIDMVPFVEDALMVFDPCQVLESAFSGNCTCQYERLCVLAKPHQKDWRSKYLDQLTGHMEEASESKHHAKMTVDELCSKYGPDGSNMVSDGVAAGVSIFMFCVGVGMGVFFVWLVGHLRDRHARRHIKFDNPIAAEGGELNENDGL